MRHAHQGRFLAKSVEHLTPRLSHLRGVVIGTHAELGIASLDRRVDHVAGDEHVLAGTTDQHRVMIDRVARRWNELHLFVERKIALHDLRAFGF